jgi:hypothetical protein
MITRFAAIGMVIFIVSCDDTMQSKYKNYADARRDRLFERGWLPDSIPKSSREFIVENNLDLNLSKGEFYFAPTDKEKEDFGAYLTRDSTCDQNGRTGYAYRRWRFQIDWKRGYCTYFTVN